MENDEELLQLAETILLMNKYNYAKWDFKMKSMVFKNAFFFFEHKHNVQPHEKWEAEQAFEIFMERMSEKVRRFPPELVEAAGDLKKFCLGFMSAEAKTLLEQYCEKQKLSL